jgi:hypothetical protein
MVMRTMQISMFPATCRTRTLLRRATPLARFQFASTLLLAGLAAAGQSSNCAQTKPSQADRSLSVNSSYQPITGGARWNWFVRSTIGSQSLAGGLFSAGFGTVINSPQEYGGHWEGYGKRYGIRLTGVSTGNAIEAGIGSLWGEDPRYYRAPGQPFGRRVQNIINMTFMARRPDSKYVPAYARYIGVSGNNVLSNTWRADSEADAQHAAVRTLLGFAGRMGSNAFQEFWPDIRRRVLKKKPNQSESSAIPFPFRQLHPRSRTRD